MSKKYDVSRGKLTKFFKNKGVKNISDRISEESMQKCKESIEFYENCKSLAQTAKKFHVATSTLSNYYKKNGIEVKNYQNECRCNEHIFDVIDTEEKAYWLGFLYADGWVSKDDFTIELCLKEEDKEHLEKFKEFMECSNEIRFKPAKLGNSYRIGMSSKHLHSRLNELGCTIQKSLNLEYPTHLNLGELERHFIRGYFDGDGWIGVKRKTGWNRCNITGTFSMIDGILNYFGFEKRVEQIKMSGNAPMFEFSKSQCEILLYTIYSNATVMIKRKYERYIKEN